MPEDIFCIDRIGHSEKSIEGVMMEGVTNTFYGNQFLGYFIKIPQIGYYSDVETKRLKGYYVDRINETIRGVSLPQVRTSAISLSYRGQSNQHFPGVGDGELGILGVKMKVDRYLNNYTALLNWSFLKYDWTKGKSNETFAIKDLHGIFVVEFLDSEEQISRKMNYKVWVEDIPLLTLGTDDTDEVEIDVQFQIVDMDISGFIEGQPIKGKKNCG